MTIDWQFNIGSNAARSSTLIRFLSQRLYASAAQQFRVWDKTAFVACRGDGKSKATCFRDAGAGVKNNE